MKIMTVTNVGDKQGGQEIATFVRLNHKVNNDIFTEPCMNCFASVTYHVTEVKDDPRVTGGKYIVCPSCGALMSVKFQNVTLC